MLCNHYHISFKFYATEEIILIHEDSYNSQLFINHRVGNKPILVSAKSYFTSIHNTGFHSLHVLHHFGLQGVAVSCVETVPVFWHELQSPSLV